MTSADCCCIHQAGDQPACPVHAPLDGQTTFCNRCFRPLPERPQGVSWRDADGRLWYLSTGTTAAPIADETAASREVTGLMESTIPTGWVCPRCQVVWAPHIDSCTCGALA